MGETSHAVLAMMPAVLLFTLGPLFVEPRVGKVQARGWKKMRRAAGAADRLSSPGWYSSRSNRHTIFSALMAQPTDLGRDTAVMPPLSRWSSHIPTAQTAHDQQLPHDACVQCYE